MSGEYHRVSAGGTTEYDPPPPYTLPVGEGGSPPAVVRSPFNDPEGLDEEDEDMGGGVVDGYAPGRYGQRSAERRDQRPVSYLDARSEDGDEGNDGGGDPFMDPVVSPVASREDLRGYER